MGDHNEEDIVVENILGAGRASCRMAVVSKARP